MAWLNHLSLGFTGIRVLTRTVLSVFRSVFLLLIGEEEEVKERERTIMH